MVIVLEHRLRGWDTDFFPRRVNGDLADERGFSRFRVGVVSKVVVYLSHGFRVKFNFALPPTSRKF